MSRSFFNTIVIIDSIPHGELNTAKKLLEDLDVISAAFAKELNIQYMRAEGIKDFSNIMATILKNLKDKAQFPLIHIEAHGLRDESGLSFADGSSCSWKQLKDLVTPINVNTGLNLMVVIASCFGGSFANVIETTDRAPLWGLLGPVRELSTLQVQVDFGKFYRVFFETKSASTAVGTLNNGSPQELYFVASAKNWFYNVWKNYKQYQCTEDKLEERARAMYRRLKADKIPRIPGIGSLKRKLKRSEETLFNKFRDTYFMYDLCPENRERFQVSYLDAEKYTR